MCGIVVGFDNVVWNNIVFPTRVKRKSYYGNHITKWFGSRVKNHIKPIRVIRVTRSVIRVIWFELEKMVIRIRVLEATNRILNLVWFESSINVIKIIVLWFESDILWFDSWKLEMHSWALSVWDLSQINCVIRITKEWSLSQNFKVFLRFYYSHDLNNSQT